MPQFTYLWTLVLVAIAIFLVGFYKNVVCRIAYVFWVNSPAYGGDSFSNNRARLPRPNLRTIINEALLQKPIRNRSFFLWIRHLLIFFGFAALFVFDQATFILGKLGHTFLHIEYFSSGPGRAFIKVGLEASGAVLFLGLTLALVHRLGYAEQERKCVDLSLIVLFWVVVLSGFLTEAFRLTAEPSDPFLRYSFLAGPLARGLSELHWAWESITRWTWIAHVTSVLAFFAYLPYSKLVHIFAAPVGRSATMGQDTTLLKIEKVSEAWF